MILSVLSDGGKVEQALVSELRLAIQGVVAAEVRDSRDEQGQLLFVDSRFRRLEDLDRRGRAVFLIIEEGATNEAEPWVLQALSEGQVDEVLVRPFRPMEVLSKIRHFQQLMLWNEVQEMNASFSELLASLRDDLQLAERMQKARLPRRFEDINGFRIASRYLAGLKAGGDHFDLADSPSSSQLSLLLSDSSSYGLASAVLSALMRVAMKLSSEQVKSSVETVARIREEVMATLRPRDHLSLFYGVISRKDLRFRYLSLGALSAFLAPADGSPLRELKAQGQALTQDSRLSQLREMKEEEIVLKPGDRLAVLSDGFTDAVGGVESAGMLLEKFRGKEPLDAVNELAFQVKSRLGKDELPAQDCTALLLDIDERVLRLA